MKRDSLFNHIRTVLVTALMVTAALSGRAQTKPSEIQDGLPKAAPIRSQAGIEVEHLRLSAHGRLVDLRYRVTDPEKAADFAKRELKPVLIDSQSGAKLQVPTSPKVGPLRQLAKGNDPKKVYFSLFSNAGMVVKPGSKVCLQLGDLCIDNLVVE